MYCLRHAAFIGENTHVNRKLLLVLVPEQDTLPLAVRGANRVQSASCDAELLEVQTKRRNRNAAVSNQHGGHRFRQLVEKRKRVVVYHALEKFQVVALKRAVAAQGEGTPGDQNAIVEALEHIPDRVFPRPIGSKRTRDYSR